MSRQQSITMMQHHHQEGNHEKANESTIKAQGHHYLASKAQKRDIIYHALND